MTCKMKLPIFLIIILVSCTPIPCNEINKINETNFINETNYINKTSYFNITITTTTTRINLINVTNYVNKSNTPIPTKIELDIKCENTTDGIFCRPLEYDFEKTNAIGIYGGRYCSNGTFDGCAKISGCENLLNGKEGNFHYYKVRC